MGFFGKKYTKNKRIKKAPEISGAFIFYVTRKG
jgi:hypothetical protein